MTNLKDSHLRIVLAQLNFYLGDMQTNLEKHIHAALKARDEYSADLIVFPELSLTGYPPEDLLLRPAFLNKAEQALQQFISQVKDIYCLVGHPLTTSHRTFNACSLIYNGKILCQYKKQCLPNYGVFDEARYFHPGQTTCVVPIKNIPIGFLICEDLWRLEPIKQTVEARARFIICANASPFELDKYEQRLSLLSKRAKHHHIPIAYINTIGGQDELIFDGGSMIVDADGHLKACAPFFKESLLPIEISLNTAQDIFEVHDVETHNTFIAPRQEERIYQALVLSLHDYIEKNHFPGVLVGLSGGIDSALTLTIAVDTLGKDRVRAIIMPSRFTADMSMEDAEVLCKNLDIQFEIISIEPPYQSFLDSLAPMLKNESGSITEQNIQARIRATILMALSNHSGYLVLTTGNRSELAVGYCTLYGDMAGGFAILKDVPKTLVYQLAAYRNQPTSIIPKRILERAPTAELAFNQKDEDSLPPYPILDQILDYYLNQELSYDDIIAKGFDAEMVTRIVNLIHKNEYKRYQAALGPHLHHKSFGKDWRYPITNGFKK